LNIQDKEKQSQSLNQKKKIFEKKKKMAENQEKKILKNGGQVNFFSSSLLSLFEKISSNFLL